MPRRIAIAVAATVTLVMGVWLLTVAAGTFDHQTSDVDAAQPTGAVVDAPANATTTQNSGDDEIGILDDDASEVEDGASVGDGSTGEVEDADDSQERNGDQGNDEGEHEIDQGQEQHEIED